MVFTCFHPIEVPYSLLFTWENVLHFCEGEPFGSPPAVRHWCGSGVESTRALPGSSEGAQVAFKKDVSVPGSAGTSRHEREFELWHNERCCSCLAPKCAPQLRVVLLKGSPKLSL